MSRNAPTSKVVALVLATILGHLCIPTVSQSATVVLTPATNKNGVIKQKPNGDIVYDAISFDSPFLGGDKFNPIIDNKQPSPVRIGETVSPIVIEKLYRFIYKNLKKVVQRNKREFYTKEQVESLWEEDQKVDPRQVSFVFAINDFTNEIEGVLRLYKDQLIPIIQHYSEFIKGDFKFELGRLSVGDNLYIFENNQNKLSVMQRLVRTLIIWIRLTHKDNPALAEFLEDIETPILFSGDRSSSYLFMNTLGFIPKVLSEYFAKRKERKLNIQPKKSYPKETIFVSSLIEMAKVFRLEFDTNLHPKNILKSLLNGKRLDEMLRELKKTHIKQKAIDRCDETYFNLLSEIYFMKKNYKKAFSNAREAFLCWPSSRYYWQELMKMKYFYYSKFRNFDLEKFIISEKRFLVYNHGIFNLTAIVQIDSFFELIRAIDTLMTGETIAYKKLHQHLKNISHWNQILDFETFISRKRNFVAAELYQDSNRIIPALDFLPEEPSRIGRLRALMERFKALSFRRNSFNGTLNTSTE